jgi:hypothetical protein
MSFGVMRGLPGCATDREPIYARTKSAALRAVREGKAVVDSQDNGAMTVWKDDNGVIRADIQRFKVAVVEEILPTMADIWPWIQSHKAVISAPTAPN